MKKTLMCIRGLPYTGKSFTAKAIAKDFEEKNPGLKGLVFSTDEFFYKFVKPELPDVYSWNPRFLAQAHKWNQQRAFRAIEMGEPLIIIDNTNTTAREFCVYVRYAYHQEFEIQIQEPTSDRWLEIRELLTNKHGNKKALKDWAIKLAEGSKETHNVPFWAIERMMWRWECDLLPDEVIEHCIANHSVGHEELQH